MKVKELVELLEEDTTMEIYEENTGLIYSYNEAQDFEIIRISLDHYLYSDDPIICILVKG